MKIRAMYAAAASVLIIGLGIGITMITGDWLTESTKQPRQITAGALEGSYDPSDIRGSHSFGDIGKYFTITPEELTEAFGIDASDSDPALFKANSMETFYEELDMEGEIGTDSLKLFVSLVEDYPYEPEETTLLPLSAYEFLKNHAYLSEEEEIKFSERFIEVTMALTPAVTELTTTEESEDHDEVSTDTTIRGRTTFGDLYAWGITEEQIIEASGIEPGPKTAVLKDYYQEHELEYGEIRVILQEIAHTK